MQAFCEKLVQGGLAFARDASGKVLLIDGALPGETVGYEVDRKTPDYQMAHVTDILHASDDRVFPRCPLYGLCGGCDLQILAGEKQAAVKEALVRENLRRVGGVSDLPSLGVASGPFWEYRCRARFHVSLSQKQVGFLGRKSNTLVPVDDCPVLVGSLRALLREKKPLLEAARKAMFAGGGDHGLFEVNAFAGDDGVSLGGEVVHLTVDGKRFGVDGKVFFQGNAFVLPEMGRFVKENCVGDRVMDLYGGVGTFSSFIGDSKELVLVEQDPGCLRLARENVPFCKVYCGDVKDWKQKDRVDTVVVDPPRIGLEKPVPALIAGWKPKRIIYMSCNSVTLARDMALFLSCGYNPVMLKVFDMYPETFGQEACIVMEGQS